MVTLDGSGEGPIVTASRRSACSDSSRVSGTSNQRGRLQCSGTLQPSTSR